MSTDVIERFAKRLSDSQEALAHQTRMNRDLQYLLSHLDEWRNRYPNRWVAVHNEELVAVEDTQERLLEAIEAKGVPLPEALIDFISEHRIGYLL